jgi:hypothetical protein
MEYYLYNNNNKNNNIFRSLIQLRWAGHIAQTGEKRNAYRLLARKPEGKRPLGGSSHRCVDNIKMDLGEVGWSGLD